MVIKPQYLESDIWANAASPTDVRRPTIDGSVEDTFTAKGWEYAEKPPYMFENWLNQHKDLMLVHINQNGIPHWDDKTVYTNKARVLFDDGTGTLAYIYQPDPYIEPTAGTPEPKSDNSTDWKVDISLTPDNVVIESIGPADAGKLIMTDANGRVHESLYIDSGSTIWDGNSVTYKKDSIVGYNGIVYIAIDDHISVPSDTPDVSVHWGVASGAASGDDNWDRLYNDLTLGDYVLVENRNEALVNPIVFNSITIGTNSTLKLI